MSRIRHVRMLLHLLVGGMVALSAVFADFMLGQPQEWGLIQSLVLITGVIIITLSFVSVVGRITDVSTKLCLSILSLFVVVALCEGIFRAIDYDFVGEERAWRKYPPFYRQPMTPTGEVFFRRQGPFTWTGQVLNQFLTQNNVEPNPYRNEPVITVTYNQFGFRIPDNISEWDVAVTGDSFTELGYLPDEQLFTTILGDLLGKRVVNLGTSYTGPLTQLSYLRDYGITPSTKHAVIVFYEGNDLFDLSDEFERLSRWQRTGQRLYLSFNRQTSFVAALDELIWRTRRYEVEAPDIANQSDYVHAYFKSSQGDIANSLVYRAPAISDIPKQNINHLRYFFESYVRLAQQKGITPWLAYMPCKRRVLDGHLRFTEAAHDLIKNWQPSNLPALLSGVCEHHGVGFIDLTPALVEETRKTSQLLYNSICDTHINALGSKVVAQELARHLTVYIDQTSSDVAHTQGQSDRSMP